MTCIHLRFASYAAKSLCRIGPSRRTLGAAEVLLEPIEMPFAGYPCKLGAVLFCPLHEMLHAGQIGLLRRSLGLSPIRYSLA